MRGGGLHTTQYTGLCKNGWNNNTQVSKMKPAANLRMPVSSPT